MWCARSLADGSLVMPDLTHDKPAPVIAAVVRAAIARLGERAVTGVLMKAAGL